MLYAHTRSSVVRLCLSALLTVIPFLISPTATLLAQPAESLSTGVIPTMGLNDVTEGTLLFKTNQQGRYTPAPLLSTDVQIAVTGIIARATVRQEFTNPSHKKGDWLEGVYVFPLPETAAVDHLRMHVGERIIEGQIKERAEAKKVYEKAKQEGKRTSLVEQERPNIFTTSVANIGPGERIIVEIEYQETIRYDQGTFHLRFPMVVGQRYIPGTPVIVEGQDPNGSGTMLETDRVPDASRITPPVQKPGQGPINPVSLSLSLTRISNRKSGIAFPPGHRHSRPRWGLSHQPQKRRRAGRSRLSTHLVSGSQHRTVGHDLDRTAERRDLCAVDVDASDTTTRRHAAHAPRSDLRHRYFRLDGRFIDRASQICAGHSSYQADNSRPLQRDSIQQYGPFTLLLARACDDCGHEKGHPIRGRPLC